MFASLSGSGREDGGDYEGKWSNQNWGEPGEFKILQIWWNHLKSTIHDWSYSYTCWCFYGLIVFTESKSYWPLVAYGWERLQHFQSKMTSSLKVITDEMKQRELLMDDEEEDFLDECIVNPSGKGCPTVLLLCAATLLSEITAYMRETYKSVPKQVKLNWHHPK